MLAAIDIGNTNIVIGIFDGDKLINQWRLSAVKDRTGDEYGAVLLNLFSNAGVLSKGHIKSAAMACVVPRLKDTFTAAFSKYFGVKPLVVEPGIKTGMPILTDNPREVGADRIAGSVAAYAEHKCALIVVDFGTAITFDYVTEKGEYAGGAIAPGITVAADALFDAAARLQKIEISKPPSPIGKNTVDGLKSGIFYGFAGLVDGVVEKIKKEAPTKPKKVIATGGEARLIAGSAASIDSVDESLVLKGLKIIYEANR